MQCPSCGHNGMLFDSHHGLEHNICEQCGTVVECDSFFVDTFQPGSQEVSSDYRVKSKTFNNGLMLNSRSKAFTESREIMRQFMDTINLPVPARELALQFLLYTKSLNRRGCVGACVYLAMKRHDIPVTIKYISNYLQVSHYAIGKVMKTLEKRIGAPAQCNAFNVDRLSHLILNQAKFGGIDGGKKRYNLLLNKTEQLLQLLLECQIGTSHQPHVIILAAGYIVWRNLLRHGWGEIKEGSNSCKMDRSCFRKETVKSFLCEVGIQLTNYHSLYAKLNLIINLLSEFAGHIPWLSGKTPSKNMIYFHLDEFLKYKSQIIALTAQGNSKQHDIKVEDLNGLQEESSSKSCGPTEESVSPVLGDCKGNSTKQSTEEGLSSAILDSDQGEEIPKYNFSINFDADLGYASILLKTEPEEEKEKAGITFRKVKYTKLLNLRKVPYDRERLKNESCDLKDKICENSSDQFLEVLSPTVAREGSYLESLAFP